MHGPEGTIPEDSWTERIVGSLLGIPTPDWWSFVFEAPEEAQVLKASNSTLGAHGDKPFHGLEIRVLDGIP